MARNKRYIRIDERTQDPYKLMAALDQVGITYDWFGHDKHISVIEIDIKQMHKTYDEAVGEEE